MRKDDVLLARDARARGVAFESTYEKGRALVRFEVHAVSRKSISRFLEAGVSDELFVDRVAKVERVPLPPKRHVRQDERRRQHDEDRDEHDDESAAAVTFLHRLEPRHSLAPSMDPNHGAQSAAALDHAGGDAHGVAARRPCELELEDEVFLRRSHVQRAK